MLQNGNKIEAVFLAKVGCGNDEKRPSTGGVDGLHDPRRRPLQSCGRRLFAFLRPLFWQKQAVFLPNRVRYF